MNYEIEFDDLKRIDYYEIHKIYELYKENESLNLKIVKKEKEIYVKLYKENKYSNLKFKIIGNENYIIEDDSIINLFDNLILFLIRNKGVFIWVKIENL